MGQSGALWVKVGVAQYLNLISLFYRIQFKIFDIIDMNAYGHKWV